MSWKDRAKKISSKKDNNWKSRAKGVTVESVSEPSSPNIAETIGHMASALDAPAAGVRSTIEGAIEGGPSGAYDAAKQYASDISTKGSAAVEEAPTGKDIAVKAGLPSEEYPIWGKGTPKVSPAGVAGFAIDFATDPLTYTPEWLGKAIMKPVIAPVQRYGQGQAAKAIARIMSASDVKSGMDAEVIGKQLFKDDLIKYVNRPKKMLKKLNGSSQVDEIVEGGVTGFKKSKKDVGEIAKVSDSLDDMIKAVEASVDVPTQVPAQILHSSTVDNIRKDMIKDLGPEFRSPEKIQKVDDLSKSLIGQPVYSLSDLRTLKKNLGTKVKPREFFANADEAVKLENEVRISMIRSIDNIIESHLSDVPVKLGRVDIGDASKYYAAQNARLNSMLNMRSLLETADLDALSKDDLTSLISRFATYGATGAAVGEAIGHPLYGAAAGLTFKTAQEAGKKSGGVAAGAAASASRSLSDDVLPFVPRVLGELQRKASEPSNNMNRSPQSVDKPIAEQLIRTPLPRDAERLYNMRPFMMAKIAQQAPEIFDNMKDVLENDPEAIYEVLPLLVQQAPQLFERDKYNRVNGRIMDPAMAEQARKDTMDNEDMSILEKTKIINRLNKTGYFDEN